MTRAEVERRLVREEEILAAVAARLRRAIPLRRWPEPLLRVLLRAIDEEGLRPAEASKAFALRRHLFGDHRPDVHLPHRHADSMETRDAERLRADLASIVELRAGVRCQERPDAERERHDTNH